MATIGAVIAGARPLRTERHGDRSPSSIVFLGALWFSLAFAVLVLAVLLIDTFIDGLPRLDVNLITQNPSRLSPETGGALPAIVASSLLMLVTAVIALPLGIAAGSYLEEFADKRKWYNRLIEVNITNLAAVPAIIYGLLTVGLAAALGMTRGIILFGGIALAMVILPVIIIATREAVRAVPQEIRQGSLALGATPLQTLRKQTLPAAIPGIATGAILAISRAFGEAAPLIMLGAIPFLQTTPTGVMSQLTALPIQIFVAAGEADEAFHELASAAIIVMLALLLMMNAVAILIRNKYQNRW